MAKQAVLLLVALAACGGRAPEPRRIVESQVLLTSPPSVVHTGVLDGWGWSARSDSASVTFDPILDTGEASQSLNVPGLILQAAESVLWREPHTLLLGALDAQERFSLYRYHDVNGDGVPDETTKTLLFHTDGPAYITEMELDADGNAYLLNRRCQDLLHAFDSDADGWPDTISAQPYAASAEYPNLVFARDLRLDQDGYVRTSASPPTRRPPAPDLPFHAYRDVDGDQISDEERLGPWTLTGLFTYGQLYEGQDEVRVRGSASESVELWSTDGQGDVQILLASATVAGNGWVTLETSRSLSLEEEVALQYQAQPSTRVLLLVRPARPQIVEIDSAVFLPTSSSSQVVTLRGNLFAEDVTFFMRDPAGQVHNLARTFLDPHTVSVTVPPLPSEGRAIFYAVAPGQPESTAYRFTYPVCD